MSGTRATRPYRMARRADTQAARRAAILDAALDLGDPRAPLAEVADRAGVSERTVLRHFGSRDGLIAAALAEGTGRVEAERFAVPPGDVEAAVANLVAHYDNEGDNVVRMLGEEGIDEGIDTILSAGREMHRRWVEEKLGPLLGKLDRRTRKRRIAQLVAACDVYTWKLLRRGSGLGQTETERAIAELIRAIVEIEEER